jgi:hypothetical protein
VLDSFFGISAASTAPGVTTSPAYTLEFSGSGTVRAVDGTVHRPVTS